MTSDQHREKEKELHFNLNKWTNAKNAWVKLRARPDAEIIDIEAREKEADEKILFYEQQIKKLSLILPTL